jgi:hypothetical protein
MDLCAASAALGSAAVMAIWCGAVSCMVWVTISSYVCRGVVDSAGGLGCGVGAMVCR